MNMSIEQYHYHWFVEKGDPRLQNWPLMSDPLMVLGIVGIYLAGLKPMTKYMENRKAYSLKKFLFVYNTFQIIANSLVLLGMFFMSDWKLSYFYSCALADSSDNPRAVFTLFLYYVYFSLKIIETVETYVFILRKKSAQVSALHVYHHSTTILVGWTMTKYIGGGSCSFHGMMNALVHVFMYTYYLLSSLGPEWQKVTAAWKPKLTAFQLTQFTLMILHAAMTLRSDCEVSSLFFFMYVPNIVVLFKMFWNFYEKAYLKKKSN